ncbi:MAG: NAD(P)H dehydrogenase assembly family protein [Cyanobacteriota bacterium]|nr:NAD(P)H dehydrogenase assembly family protein [Cyanobacteriota bacterium]
MTTTPEQESTDHTTAIGNQPFRVGDGVQLRGQRRYLKSADPMPMLRPPDLVQPEEEGRVVELRAGDQLAVRFRRGTFLLMASELSPATSGPPPDSGLQPGPPG